MKVKAKKITDEMLLAIFGKFIAPRAYECLRVIYGYDEFMKRVMPQLRDDMGADAVVDVMEAELDRITAKFRKAMDGLA